MKCIDPWLLNNRRQCPVCKRYVFPNQDNSDEENNSHTATERTPLIRQSDDDPVTTPPRNLQIGKYMKCHNHLVHPQHFISICSDMTFHKI
jgi:hypothetical protein